MIINPYFKRSEFACACGCGFDAMDAELLTVLTSIREHFDSPLVINSGCRCVMHNAQSGGSVGSQHTLGKAADIVVTDIDAATVADYIDSTFPDQYGLGRYRRWTHIDVRSTKARWSKLRQTK